MSPPGPAPHAIEPPVVPPFTVRPPAGPCGPIVFASPHSGMHRPADMGEIGGLSDATLRSAEDVGVDQLVASATDHGIPLLAANVSRAYVDLNRAPTELDPDLVDGCEGLEVTPKVTAGFGVIPRRAGDGTVLYDRRLTAAEARARLEAVHAPYHDALARLMRQARAGHGRALLIDWHSMPSRATGRGRSGRGVDVVIGDRHGGACRSSTSRRVRAALEAVGWRVGLNIPYAGGYATQLWGRPGDGFEALQIELNRALYLDEATLTALPGEHARVTAALTRVIAAIARDLSAS